MSKIKSIDIDGYDVRILLDSGVSIVKGVDNGVLKVFDFCVSKLVGVEIFDLEYIDSVIKNFGDRNSVFSVSKIFLELGAVEFGKTIYEYIGDGNVVPCIYSNESFDGYNVINIVNYFTITDVIYDVLNLSNVVLVSDDLIVCDLAIGLGVSFIKTNNLEVADRLKFLSFML